MPKFAANLSMLFDDVPFLDRFARAADAGFTAVEFLFPYAFPLKEIRRRLEENRLALVLHNLPAGNWDEGERGIACHPDRVQEFRLGVSAALRYASELGVPQLNCLAGKAPARVAPELLRETLVENLRHAAACLRPAGIKLLVEPVNTFDMPGFYLNGTEQALSVIEETGADNLFLQYDLYHAQRMEGELAATLERHLARIAHVQLADNPGRHEPGTGEINYPFLLAHLDRIGYTGWVGCEYRPVARTEAGLGWRTALSTSPVPEAVS